MRLCKPQDDYSHVSDSLITGPVIAFPFSTEIMNYTRRLLIPEIYLNFIWRKFNVLVNGLQENIDMRMVPEAKFEESCQ